LISGLEVGKTLQQREKLASLGKLSAGLAHELHNPDAAGQRAAKQLRSAVQKLQSRTLAFCDRVFSSEQRQILAGLEHLALTLARSIKDFNARFLLHNLLTKY
jgi:nitrogen-specific signal transduction histidine kinase